MTDDGLEINVDSFLKDVERIATEFPLEAEKRLKKIGNKFKKIVVEKSPDSGKDSKHKLKKSWKVKIEGLNSKELKCNIYSTSPHIHLQDRGHVQLNKQGNPIRFIQGKHFLESTNQEINNNVIPQELESFIKHIKRKIERG